MLSRALGLDPRERLDGLLQRMRYGYGTPPVFQPAIRESSTEAECELGREINGRGTWQTPRGTRVVILATKHCI